MPDGDCDPQHARTSSFPGLRRSLELVHSPSLPRLSGTDCRYTFVLSSRLTVLKSRWSPSSSPLTAPNWYVSRHCMISVWQVISHCVDARPCNDLSVVLRRVRNCRRIIIIIKWRPVALRWGSHEELYRPFGLYNRSNTTSEKCFNTPVENALSRCQFGVKWGKNRGYFIGFSPPMKGMFPVWFQTSVPNSISQLRTVTVRVHTHRHTGGQTETQSENINSAVHYVHLAEIK